MHLIFNICSCDRWSFVNWTENLAVALWWNSECRIWFIAFYCSTQQVDLEVEVGLEGGFKSNAIFITYRAVRPLEWSSNSSVMVISLIWLISFIYATLPRLPIDTWLVIHDNSILKMINVPGFFCCWYIHDFFVPLKIPTWAFLSSDSLEL